MITLSTSRRRGAPIAFFTHLCFLFSLFSSPRRAFAEEPVVVEKTEGAEHIAPTSSDVPSTSESKKPTEATPDHAPVEGAAPTVTSKAAPTHDVEVGSAAKSGTGITDPLVLPTVGDKTGVSSQAISVPQGTGKIQGMGESFSAQLSTGIATFTIPFSLPSARGDAQPSLGLSYNSASGHGVAGVGWDVGVPYIARQTDRGLPRYADPTTSWLPTQDRFVFNGGQELVPICLVDTSLSCSGALAGEVMPTWGAGWMYFRPRIEGSYQRFFWSPDHAMWRVQDKSGVTMELGGSPDSLETDPSHPTHVFRWNLSKEYDAHVESSPPSGVAPRPVNVVLFEYLHDGDLAYLSDIYDTPPAGGAGSAATSTFAHHVHLSYDSRPDATISYRRGWPTTMSLRLTTVDVTSKTFDGDVGSPRELVRRYHLTYDPDFHVSLLASVQLEGKCPAGANPVEVGILLPPTTCARLPAITFGYQHVTPFDVTGKPSVADLVGYEGFDERLHAMPSSPTNSVDEDLTDLFDINSDALPDVLVTAPALFGGGDGVFFNGGHGAADTFAFATMPVAGVLGADAGTVTLSNANVAALDVDGDGTIDLLHMPRVKTYAVYTPTKVPSGGPLSFLLQGRVVSAADGLDPRIDFGKDSSNIRVVDANGDGLVDVVYTSGTDVQTFFALGRYPGGDGQFGTATWTGPSTASISNDPVHTCVPWSGSPVQFSNNEIRLGDMNGDGLADIVKIQKGNIQYWPGRGNGLWGTGNIDDCAAGTFGSGRDVAMASSPWYTEPDVSALRLDDVNGDGLDDLVQVGFTDISVWLNVDGAGWTDRHVIAGTPAAPGYAPRVRLVDMNGSGTRDILWGDGGNYQYMDLAGGERPWVLTRVDNGLGKTTELEYASSTELMLEAAAAKSPWESVAPIPIHVVVRETERDNLGLLGRPSGVYVTEYAYRDPVYDGRQREFRGFKQATVKRIGDANSPTSSTTSTFLLGECGPDPSDATFACDISQRWRDNHNEALKGLPVTSESFDETGIYLSTLHRTYTLRQLFEGLDGRVVRVAFESATDEYRYDAAPFVPDSSSIAFTDVAFESAPATSGGALVTGSLTLRSSAGHAHIQSQAVVDGFGNQIEDVDRGCIDGCSPVDDVITEVTEPARPVGDSSGWLWRTTHSYVFGGATGAARHEMFFVYDAFGELIQTKAELSGTLPLDRFHEDSSAAVAPTPPSASTDGEIVLSAADHDERGNVIAESGADGRCRSVIYDSTYADLAVAETVYVGDVGSTTCGSTSVTSAPRGATGLTASAQYDRGLELIRQITDLRGELTAVDYDGFGRLVALTKPDPASAGALSPLPSVKVEYRLPDITGRPYSLIHTQTQDGATPSDDSYRNAWAYVDGLGRTIATLDQADPTAGDGGDFVVNGLTLYDAKGAAQRVYRAWFYSGDGATFPLSTIPPTPYSSQRYDAFGRVFQTYNLDGTIALVSFHHALSVDAWDREDLSPGPHYGTFASTASDGHGRTVSVTERIHAGTAIEAHETRTAYLPTGEILSITRNRVGTSDSVTRWMRYDSLGRRILNVEPNTSVGFDPNPAADASAIKAWRYAYDDAGDLVGTSDARGCGANYLYDSGGRIVAEDYSPCEASHAVYSAPDFAAQTGLEVLYHYDVADAESATSPASSCPSFFTGRLASVSDRGAKTLTCFDGRGRVVLVARRIAKPGTPDDALANRYASQWFSITSSYDGADRPVVESTGATVAELLGADGKSEVRTSYTKRGSVRSVGGSYGTIVDHVHHDADGVPLEIQYGDVAGTTTTFEYDSRRRLKTLQTYRDPPSIWTSPPSTYLPPPTYGSGTPSTFQTLLQYDEFVYDEVDNPVEIRDNRIPDEWPAGAKPVSRSVEYDDLYRLTRIQYAYAVGDDTWVSPFAPEDLGTATDPKLATPSPHVAFDKRVLWQTYEYDWLGNTTRGDDDVHGFYDRSIGAIENGGAGAGPYQLKSAANDAAPGAKTGHLTAAYDAAGNLRSLAIVRAGGCLPTGAICSQRFVYGWDEIGRLVRARRWDIAGDASDGVPAAAPSAELAYGYNGNDQRVLKSAVDGAGDARHTLYPFQSVELRRATYDDEAGNYEATFSTEQLSLRGGGVRLALVDLKEAEAPALHSDQPHVVFQVSDYLGSSMVSIDQATGEVVEAATYLPYGETESDARPLRWRGTRADYRFTAKEEDVELGLTYFGKRYYASELQRWASADPLAIHSLTADLNVYSYVRGRPLQAIDPVGLDDVVAFDADVETAQILAADADRHPSEAQSLVKSAASAAATGWADVAARASGSEGSWFDRLVVAPIATRFAIASDAVNQAAGGDSVLNAGHVLKQNSSTVMPPLAAPMPEAAGAPASSAVVTTASPAPVATTKGGSLPVEKGKAGVALSVAKAATQGKKVVGSEVTFKTLDGKERARVDLLVGEDGPPGVSGVESKNGPGAKLSKQQKKVYPKLQSEGGIPVGKNAEKAGLTPGEPVGPIKIQVDKWNTDKDPKNGKGE